MKSNKLWSITLMTALMLVMSIAISSCGDDDTPTPNDPTNNEGNNGNNNNDNGSETNYLTKILSVVPFNGKYLSNISATDRYRGWEFSYSSNNLLSFEYNRDGYGIKRVTYTDGAYRTDTDGQRISKLETNQDGFITLLIRESNEYFADTCYFYYSGRNLSKISRSYREGRTARLIETYDFEWQNGNIVQVENSQTRYEHEKEDSDQRTYKIFYDQTQNVNRQYPYIFTHYIFGKCTFAALINIGLLGDGPQLLPSVLNEYAYQRSANYSILTQTNSDGLVSSESVYRRYDDGTIDMEYRVDFTYIDAKK